MFVLIVQLVNLILVAYLNFRGTHGNMISKYGIEIYFRDCASLLNSDMFKRYSCVIQHSNPWAVKIKEDPSHELSC